MYFCRNCGEPYAADESIMCAKCGVPKGQGANYCSGCGKPIAPEDVVCRSCGIPNHPPVPMNAKSKLAAGLLGIFLGSLGVHNFYMGYTSRAAVQLAITIVGAVLSCVGIGVVIVAVTQIWGLIEGIMILAGKINMDANGLPLAE